MTQFLTLVILLAGQPMPSDSLRTPADSLRRIQLDEVVVSASRVSERVLRSPVSIEVLDTRQIRQSPSLRTSTPSKTSKAFRY